MMCAGAAPVHAITLGRANPRLSDLSKERTGVARITAPAVRKDASRPACTRSRVCPVPPWAVSGRESIEMLHGIGGSAGCLRDDVHERCASCDSWHAIRPIYRTSPLRVPPKLTGAHLASSVALRRDTAHDRGRVAQD